MTDTDDFKREFSKLFAEAQQSVENSYHVCILCEETFEHGYKARRHALEEHRDHEPHALDAVQPRQL